MAIVGRTCSLRLAHEFQVTERLSVGSFAGRFAVNQKEKAETNTVAWVLSYTNISDHVAKPKRPATDGWNFIARQGLVLQEP